MLCFWILPRHSLEQTTTTADRGPNISRGPNPSCSKKLFPPRLPAAPHISRPSFRETSRTWVGFLDPLPIKSSSPGNPPLSVRSLGQHLSPLPLLRSDVPAGSFLKPFLGGKQSCLCFAPIWCEIAVALASIALFWNCAAIGFEKPRGLQVQGHTVQACICVYAGHCVSFCNSPLFLPTKQMGGWHQTLAVFATKFPDPIVSFLNCPCLAGHL